MILVDGSSTVFQRILDLPYGYYQYKFLVDDIWRVDEQQACVQDDHGAINNVVLVVETGLMPPRLHSLDFLTNQNSEIIPFMTPLVSTPGPMLHTPLVLLQDSEMDIMRCHVSMHLSASKAYDLMPNSGKVVLLDVGVPIRHAFHVMYEKGVSVVPLWDEERAQISGMLTASDFILILLQLHQNFATLTDEEIEMHTISSWKDVKLLHHRDSTGASEPPYRRSLVQAGPDESLKDVALRALHNRISTLPVLNSTGDGSSSLLLCIACLANILKYICSHCGRDLELMPLLHKPVADLPLGTWAREVDSRSGRQLLTLRESDLLSSALNLLIQANVSSLPVVDDRGTLVNIYSRSDITSLANANVYAHIRLDQTTISQALNTLVVENQTRYQTCTRFDSLLKVMKLLSDPAVRRVVIIDACTRRVQGIITLRDIFSFILG